MKLIRFHLPEGSVDVDVDPAFAKSLDEMIEAGTAPTGRVFKLLRQIAYYDSYPKAALQNIDGQFVLVESETMHGPFSTETDATLFAEFAQFEGPYFLTQVTVGRGLLAGYTHGFQQAPSTPFIPAAPAPEPLQTFGTKTYAIPPLHRREAR